MPEAVCLSSLTYHEAWELSYFGANVLHPRTTLPAMKYHIPITIRNFFNLAAPGALQPPLGLAAGALACQPQLLRRRAPACSTCFTGAPACPTTCPSPLTSRHLHPPPPPPQAPR